MSKVIDLDILRPEPNYVQIGGKKIDVSFIPCGITFELDAAGQDLAKLDQSKIQTDRTVMKQAFELGVRICSIFCSHDYPEMDEEWFMKNTSMEQVNYFATAIQTALGASYEGVKRHSKN